MFWLLARELKRMKGDILRTSEWEESVDLFFYRDADEIKRQQDAKLAKQNKQKQQQQQRQQYQMGQQDMNFDVGDEPPFDDQHHLQHQLHHNSIKYNLDHISMYYILYFILFIISEYI